MKQHGFTLVEVAVAMLLFTIGIGGGLYCHWFAAQQITSSTQQLLASALLSDLSASLQPSTQAEFNFSGQFTTLPPVVSPCTSSSPCPPVALIQQQLQLQLAPLFKQPHPLLPAAKLCLNSQGWFIQLNLSWRNLQQKTHSPSSAFCPVASGRQQLQIDPVTS